MANNSLGFAWDRRFIAGFVVAGFEALAAVALLATSAYLISRASDQPPILYLMVAVVGVRAFALGRASARYLQRLILHDSVFRRLTNLRPVLFRKLADLVPGVVSSRSKALESFTADVERLQDYPLRVLVPMLQAISAIATMLAIAIWIFPFAAMTLVLVAILFMLLILLLSYQATSKLENERLEASSALNQKLLGFVSNIDVLSGYGWAASELKNIADQGNITKRIDLKRVFPAAASIALLGFGAVVTASVGGFVVAGSMDQIVPAVLAVAVLMPLAVFDVFAQLQSVSAAWKSYRLSRTRLSEIMDLQLPPELMLRAGAEDLKDFSELSLSQVEVRRGGKPVLSKVNHRFSVGKLSALVGPSGSGKSSLALCLSSLIQHSEGFISVDKQPLENFTLASRREKIVLIEQQPHIFRGTVKQNLEISGELDDQQMVAALSLVGLDFEFEQRGLLAAELSEDAANISGGQAQRLAIARGLLAGARVLILDEPTSGLDRANSLALMEILRQLAGRNLAVILITHDPELAELCDETLDLTEFSAN